MSESIQVIGKIKIIMDEETFPSGFSKRCAVVTTLDNKYPQDIQVEFIKDKGALLDAFSAGDEVTITTNIQGREYNGKYYVSLNGWQIKRIGGQSEPAPNEVSGDEHGAAVDDNLPF